MHLKEKAVFIAHSYHKKTRSCDFMIDYLKEYFDLEVQYDEEWETGQLIDWDKFDDSYKAVIIWQMFPEGNYTKEITHKNVIFFPMYDQAVRYHFSKWYFYKNIKIVCFCKALYKKLKNFGFNTIYVQYFVEPKEFSPGAEDEVFFWQRLTKININTIKKIFSKSNVKIHIHKTVDPGQNFISPSKQDEEKFKITYSEWFDTQEEMQEFIKNKGIYITPRFTEGIGLSFLEAIAQGKVVIAHNSPTMNEYIEQGKTGFLCNFKFPKAIKLSNINQIQQNTYEYAKKGYEKWLLDRKNIIDYINQPAKENKLKLWTRLCLPFLLINRRKIIKVKLGSNPSFLLFGIKIFGPK